MTEHAHHWKETGRVEPHAYGAPVVYLRCAVCGQDGFRKPDYPVVYTWRCE
jgi:hypothetical protein